MKTQRMRPAFVVTLAALAPIACQRQTETSNPPVPRATSTASAETTNETPPKTGWKHRSVRNPLPAEEQLESQPDYSKVKRLNPHGAENRTIMTSADGSCYVEVQKNPDGPIGPPGTGLVAKGVDCPDLMQDPAWDTCLNGDLARTEKGDCFCERMGNPPPPPMKAECPKSVP